MANVLVCVKRVPDTAGEVLLSADGLSVDARHVGCTVSPHEPKPLFSFFWPLSCLLLPLCFECQ